MNAFTELQYIGERVLRFQVEAKTYPEMVRLRELLDMTNEACELLDSERFEALIAQTLRS